MRRRVFGIEFAVATQADIISEVSTRPVPYGAGARLLLTTNLAHVVTLRKNPKFRAAYNGAWKITIDGAPVYFYAKLRGAGVPERVTGADLFPEILNALSPEQHRPFFVAPRESTCEGLVSWLLVRGFAAEQIGCIYPPLGFEKDLTYSERVAAQIRDHHATHLFFGLGIPKSEIWMSEHRARLGDLYAFAFGAALEFFTGEIRRAPKLLQRAGFEWTWRVAQEPNRLFRRYFVESWGFIPAVVDDLLSRGMHIDDAEMLR